MVHEFIPTAKAKRGKGPRTKKQALRARRRGDQQSAIDAARGSHGRKPKAFDEETAPDRRERRHG